LAREAEEGRGVYYITAAKLRWGKKKKRKEESTTGRGVPLRLREEKSQSGAWTAKKAQGGWGKRGREERETNRAVFPIKAGGEEKY